MIHVQACKWQSTLFGALVTITWFTSFSCSATDNLGKHVFMENCSSCHTIGGGRLVGPDLANVHKRRTLGWLKKFIKSSQTLIIDGDPQAIAIFNEFNQIPMPDPAINEQELNNVVAYLKDTSSKLAVVSFENESANANTVSEMSVDTKQTMISETSTPLLKNDIIKGQQLFQGIARFTNGGPTCNSCHDIKNDAVIGGGILATELTTVFSKMGDIGVRAILGKPPFPVMQAAYKEKPLTKTEIVALVSFLQHTDQEHIYQQPRDYGIGLFFSGMIGSVILLVFYSILWMRRRKSSVNQGIYDRQLKSSSDD